MSIRRTDDVSARLTGLRRCFDRWRRTRKGRSRIPETLWTAAVKAAGKYGLNPTARALRLDYYALKKRFEATGHLSDGGAVATLTKNRVRFQRSDDATMTVYAQATALQQRALSLLQVSVKL